MIKTETNLEHNKIDFYNVHSLLFYNYPNKNETMKPYYSQLPLFSEKECDEIIKIGNASKLEYQKTANNILDLSKFNSKQNFILPSKEVEYIYDRIRQEIIQQNNKLWFFNIFDFGEPLKFMEYNETFRGFANIHVDLGPIGACRFRKLTIIIQLSDDNSYEGGDLLIFNDKPYKMPRERGTIIIFPSFILHKVEPVTKGIRNSLVTFAYGPPFC